MFERRRRSTLAEPALVLRHQKIAVSFVHSLLPATARYESTTNAPRVDLFASEQIFRLIEAGRLDTEHRLPKGASNKLPKYKN
jgi:hypothetical protein